MTSPGMSAAHTLTPVMLKVYFFQIDFKYTGMLKVNMFQMFHIDFKYTATPCLHIHPKCCFMLKLKPFYCIDFRIM